MTCTNVSSLFIEGLFFVVTLSSSYQLLCRLFSSASKPNLTWVSPLSLLLLREGDMRGHKRRRPPPSFSISAARLKAPVASTIIFGNLDDAVYRIPRAVMAILSCSFVFNSVGKIMRFLLWIDVQLSI